MPRGEPLEAAPLMGRHNKISSTPMKGDGNKSNSESMRIFSKNRQNLVVSDNKSPIGIDFC